MEAPNDYANERVDIVLGFYGYDAFVPESVIETAERWEKIIKATGLDKRRSYTKLEREDRYAVGYVAELTFCNFLFTLGKKFFYRPKLTGRSDTSGSDVHVWSIKTGNKIKLNVKCAGEAYQREMMTPEKQFRLWRAQIYVSTQHLGVHWLGIHGWVRRDEYEKKKPRKIKIDTRPYPFDELHHIDKLLEKIQPI